MIAASLVMGAAACGDDGSDPIAVPPQLVSVSPLVGTSGTEVRIDGQGFDATDVSVFFDDIQSPRVALEGGAVFALAPAGLTLGTTYDIRVVNRGTGSAVLDSVFTVVAPEAFRINGVSRPTGLRGMTVIIEGASFGDSLDLAQGSVLFRAGDGSAVAAPILDQNQDWNDSFIVTQVPQTTADTSLVWVETATGASDSIEFRIIQSGVFSPSLINWTQTTALPQPLQGLGAVFVPIEDGAMPANHIFTVGGADTLNVATTSVYTATVQESGALTGGWNMATPLPQARAYHTLAAATAFTAALDTTTTGGILYAIGGVDDAGATSADVWMAQIGLDGSLGSWVPASTLPQPLHSASASLFRGFLYLTGGADSLHAATGVVYRAAIAEDGSLGAWESIGTLPGPRAYHAQIGFGPFLHVIGGDAGTTDPVTAGLTGSETSAVHFARISVRTGDLSGGWSATQSMSKARSKHSAIFGGGALFATSGVYAGQPGSSENTFASLNNDGTTDSWNGATGSEIIEVEIGISLYNQAAVTFLESDGTGHVLVLGGASRSAEGQASDAVVFY
ncbi:MAG: IPT/TIG domain-containing protein [Gemmatimonadota bacterium]